MQSFFDGEDFIEVFNEKLIINNEDFYEKLFSMYFDIEEEFYIENVKDN